MNEDTLFSVTDQVVLASGASRGIGRALAEGFAQRGAQVIVTGRDRDTLEATARAIAPEGSTVDAMVCDVADLDQIDSVVTKTIETHGRIDTLLNIAGVNRRRRVETYDVEDFDFILNINLKGAFWTAQRVGRHMLEQGRGAQINIDSLNTYAPLKGVVPYAMSKGGMSMMTRGMALEWAERGVRVNGIAPGFILTDLSRKMWAIPKMKQWCMDHTPMNRFGDVDDLIGTALYLASDASRFMTGQTLYVDGGASSGQAWPIDLD